MTQVTLTTAKTFIHFNVKGSGKIEIDWKDGKKEETTLIETGATYTHKYVSPNLGTHTITLTTQQNSTITGLTCDCNELTGTLNVSELVNLKTL
ncbi:MAG: hypothetical protein FWF27_04050, partial [Candidatus Bathyarchaeota archaeon]|nr:hypothetical protein [Candidatus Termiticorpusculum sp.]